MAGTVLQTENTPYANHEQETHAVGRPYCVSGEDQSPTSGCGEKQFPKVTATSRKHAMQWGCTEYYIRILFGPNSRPNSIVP